MSDNQFVDGGISRRAALERGFLVGGAVWVVPAVQVVTMTEAHAEAASGPASWRADVESGAGRGRLPKTGADLDPALAAGAGAALVAIGIATLAAQRRRFGPRAATDAAAAEDMADPPAAPADGPA
jgi:LPXTG-motif cell wall-anchored protein